MTRLFETLRRVAPFTTAALILALAYLGWQFASRRDPGRPVRSKPSAGIPDVYTGTDLKVLQFYASPATIQEGDKAILCYGVANAKTVLVEPAVGAVDPSFNRCVDIAPEQTTTYTLTATGSDGSKSTASFVMQVTPDRDKLPRIIAFTRGKKQQENGRTIYTLCFDTRNGAEVRVEPRAFPPGPILQGCFYAVPQATTTYKLIVTDLKGRKAERDLKVEVP